MKRNILKELIGLPNKSINFDLIDEKGFFDLSPQTFNSLERLHSNIYSFILRISLFKRTEKEKEAANILALKSFVRLFYKKLNLDEKQAIYQLEKLLNEHSKDRTSEVLKISLNRLIKIVLKDDLDYIFSLFVIISDEKINLKEKPIRLSDETESIYLALRKYELILGDNKSTRGKTSLRAFAEKHYSLKDYKAYKQFIKKPKNLDYLDSKLTKLIELFE